MNAALNRARTGALILAAVCVVSILAYSALFDKPLLEGIYWTVITIAGVGYSQVLDAEVTEARQYLSVFVIVVGMMAMAYTVAMFVQAVIEGQIDQALEKVACASESRSSPTM